MIDAPDMHDALPLESVEQDTTPLQFSLLRCWFGQLMRFGTVGGLNTILDLLILNTLLWLFPTTNALTLVLFNSLAYALGAVNSFFLNKYWTFAHKKRSTLREVRRFIITTALGIACNDILLWCANRLFQPLIEDSSLWVNASKLVAIAGTVLVSYFGMRLWVFVNHSDVTHAEESMVPVHASLMRKEVEEVDNMPEQIYEMKRFDISKHSLSVVLPAYNEEQVIAHTVSDVLSVLPQWTQDFEVIVVDDGSRDQTATISTNLRLADPHVRLIQHEVNRGYGAALVSGFAAATKEYTFFMDSDGQFDIRDLTTFFLFLNSYDAVIGYRLDRQDTTLRKFNAWGWKQAVKLVLGVEVRDIDCAFKLLPTEFLHMHPLETRGAMINAELLYKLRIFGYIYKEVGVRHLPRLGGKATGAKIAVIVRAFRELFTYARRWRRERPQVTAIRTAVTQHSRRQT